MTGVRVKPRRRLRNELYVLALVLLVPVSLLLAFPYEALGFSLTRPSAAAPSSCAFVVLTEEQAERALNESRSYWKVDTKGARNLRLELSETDAPEEDTGSVLPFGERKRLDANFAVGYRVPPLPPTLAAGEPASLGSASAAPDATVETFSREELLNVSEFDLKGN